MEYLWFGLTSLISLVIGVGKAMVWVGGGLVLLRSAEYIRVANLYTKEAFEMELGVSTEEVEKEE